VSGHIKWTDLPFSGVSDWEEIKAAARPMTMAITRAWIQGYMTSLEDVIKDLYVQETDYVNDPGAKLAIEMIWNKVQSSLASAQKTLDTINKIMEEGEVPGDQHP